MRTRWEKSHIELLINILKEHEVIWNSKHPRYSTNPKVRQKHWKGVLKIFYDSLKEKAYEPQDVQGKWHNLRCQFYLQHQRYSTKGFGKKRWRYYDMLKFLTGHGVSKRQPAVLVDRKKYYLRAKVVQSMMEESDEESDIASMSPRSSTDDDEETNNNHTLPKEVVVSNPTEKESDDDSYVSIGSISPRYQDDAPGDSTFTSETKGIDWPQSPKGENKRFEADVAGACDVDSILQVDLNK